jgi:hypothetical protein
MAKLGKDTVGLSVIACGLGAAGIWMLSIALSEGPNGDEGAACDKYGGCASHLGWVGWGALMVFGVLFILACVFALWMVWFTRDRR